MHLLFGMPILVLRRRKRGPILIELFRVIYVFGTLPGMYGPPRD